MVMNIIYYMLAFLVGTYAGYWMCLYRPLGLTSYFKTVVALIGNNQVPFIGAGLGIMVAGLLLGLWHKLG